MRIVAGAAAGYAEAGYRTIVDGIVIPGWFLEPLRDALREAGHEVAYAVLSAPLEACLERVQGREGDPPVDAGAIEQLWRSFARPRRARGARARRRRPAAPSEVAELLAQRLADGRLSV